MRRVASPHRCGRCLRPGARRSAPARRRPETENAAIRRHARDRHRLRHAVGAVLGHGRLELEAQPRHRPVLRAAVRRRPVQVRSNGGQHPFYADAWLPSDAIRGELAESWEWKENPLRVEIKLRKGVMFPEKPGVMASRELTADDVVFSFNRLVNSPKKIDGLLRPRRQGGGDRPVHRGLHLQGIQRRMGLSLRLGLLLRHRCRRKSSTPAPANWKNVNGTGPFMLTDFVQGNSNTYAKNPIYWDQEKIDGTEYKLPFVDKIVYRTIKDEATLHHRAAHRQARHPRDHPLAERRQS